jgi:hypothetical protein
MDYFVVFVNSEGTTAKPWVTHPTSAVCESGFDAPRVNSGIL